MPTLTLTKADLLNWAVDINSQSAPGGTLNISGSGDVGELDIDGIASDTETNPTGGSGAGAIGLNWDINAYGELDISSIPALSIINSVEITCSAGIEAGGTSEGDVAATFAGAGSCTATAYVNVAIQMEISICMVDLPELFFEDNANDVDSGVNSASAEQINSQSDAINYNDTTVLEIPKESFTAFVAFNTDALNQAAGGASSTQPRLTCVSSASTDLAAELHVISWEVTITYTPAVSELEVTQSGEMALSGGGLVQTNNIVQAGEIYLDGGGSDFYIIAPEISGIYVLVPNKRDDTWYDKTVNPAVTIDVKIPDPFVSFAFLPEDE